MPKPTITLRKAVMCAEMAMVLYRQAFKFDASMYDRGVFNQKTQNAKVSMSRSPRPLPYLNPWSRQ